MGAFISPSISAGSLQRRAHGRAPLSERGRVPHVHRKRPRATLDQRPINAPPDWHASELQPKLTRPTPSPESPKEKPEVEQLRELAFARGALGRGVRATLRAFYRRASFVIAASDRRPTPDAPVYVEIGPAYVLATARQGTESATRYAVERRAWPRLRALLNWEELPTTEARYRGASLRRLNEGGRYGRHVFLSYAALADIMSVAEDLVVAEDVPPAAGKHTYGKTGRNQRKTEAATANLSTSDSLSSWPNVQLEALIDLRRRPIPGVRTVAAKCPRGSAHSNGDRNPSLVLWMNADGLTGGALCPVCTEDRRKTAKSPGASRNMTWRVHYIRGNVAALCTPLRRISSPKPVKQAMAEWRKQNSNQRDSMNAAVARHAFRARNTNSKRKEVAIPTAVDTDPTDGQAMKGTRRNAGDHAKKAGSVPVGGGVLTDEERLSQIGHTVALAYVTASLKIERDADTTLVAMADSEESVDGMKLRTVGTKARLHCPMQILLWSERRSRGPTSAQRVEDVSWYARQTLGVDDTETEASQDSMTTAEAQEETLASEAWIPTGVVSVSTMRPSGWREVVSGNGQLVTVPSGWEAAAQAWVLFDLDNMEGLGSDAVVEQVCNKMTLTIRRNLELSGRCLVMQTGPTGLHVWAELREVREDGRTWFKNANTRAWYADVGQKLLKAAYRGGAAGGKVDMSSCCGGRFARRPGWRLLKDGTPYRSHVVTYVAGRVKSRKPRHTESVLSR